MFDPFTSVVSLLQPQMSYSSIVTGSGRWGVRRCDFGEPIYGVMLQGRTRLAVEGAEPVVLHPGDFVLIPSMPKFTMTSFTLPEEDEIRLEPVLLPNGELRHGTLSGQADVRFMIGFCKMTAADASLLLSLLPKLVHVRGDLRLSALVQLVIEESNAQRPGKDVVLEKLLEVLFIEALRSSNNAAETPGLLRGLSDARLAAAIRSIHECPGKHWTVALLAKESALSRSAFFKRFQYALGVTPMDYLLSWRIALAKKLLREKVSITDVATQVGYSSASTFTVAFTRQVGTPPGHYANNLL